MVDLKAKPFNLNNEQIKWVEEIIGNMNIDEKIGQLFVQVGLSTAEPVLDKMLSKKPGGVMFRPQGKEEVLIAHKYLDANSKIPLLFAANIEAGADGLFMEGTKAGNNMLVAATDDESLAFEQGRICMSEARSVGGNVAFAPVVDINYNFENPITNTRSYGDDVNKIIKMSKAYTDGVQANGGSVMVKHFPGDGVDGRDQHLLTTSNTLGFSDWKKTYGEIYKQNIDNGALGVMVGHISLPSYFEENNISDEDKNLPASLSYNLLTKLLREELGFNGLTMTDATLMAGFGSNGKRSELVPRAIAAGNDMFLFTKNMDEDFESMKTGYQNGIISEERLNDALSRILGLKAKLNLIEKEERFVDITEEIITLNQKVADDIASKGITLVKNEEGIIPLSPKTKIGLFDFTQKGHDGKSFVYDTFKQNLVDKGCEVVDLDFGVGFDNMQEFLRLSDMSVKEMTSMADVYIYVTEYLPASNKTSIRINYRSFAGLDAPWFVNEVPTMFVSFGSPYHGYDFVDIKTGINSYFNSKHTIGQTVEKMFSGSFIGTSPVKLDYKPFTGEVE